MHVPTVVPAAWAFTIGAKGRPELADTFQKKYPEAAGLRFNLSHTQNLYAVIVTRHLDCGVDVETCTRSTDMVSVGRRSFTAEEFESFLHLPQAARRQRFFELWTLKESYIKAIGTGLSTSLKAFRFDVEAEPPVIAFSAALRDEPDRWRLGLRKPDVDHQLGWAVGVDQVDTDLAVDVRWYRSAEPDWLRCSG